MWPDNPDDQSRLLYLLVLGGGLAFLSLGGRRLGGALRDLLFWGLIIVMLVIAYGFRDVLTAQLFPARTVQLEDGGIRLGRASDGHFYATVEANGQPLRLVVDTGATKIVLSRADARRIGIDPDALGYSGRALTANGSVRTAPVRIDSLTLGGLTDRDVPAAVTDGALETSLLGMTYLSRFARIEIEGDRMLLTP